MSLKACIALEMALRHCVDDFKSWVNEFLDLFLL